MDYKVYADENPVDKKAMRTLKTTGKTKLNNIKKFSKTHSKVATQNKIQNYLAWMGKLAKSSVEISHGFNEFLIKRNDVKSYLENLNKNLADYKGHDILVDPNNAKKTLKLMNKYPTWKYYSGDNGGTYHFIGSQDTDENILPTLKLGSSMSGSDKDDTMDFLCNIKLYDIKTLNLIVSDAIDFYDDNYLDYDATQKEWDKVHHCQIVYKKSKFPHQNSWKYKKLRRDKSSYLIKTGISNLHTFHHWEDVKRILDGFALIRNINLEKSFDVNFNPNHLDRNQVCLHHSSKYWLKMLKYWPKKLNINKSGIPRRAKKYINKDVKHAKHTKAYNKHDMKHASNKLYYAIKDNENLLNKSLKNHYFTRFARKHIKVHQDKKNPNAIIANFIGHQPFCIDRSDDIMDNYLKYSAKYDTKNKTVTFSDNNSIADLIKGLFGDLGLGPSMPSHKQTNKKYSHIKGIHQLNSAFIDYYKNILDVFNKHGFRDFY